MSQVAAFLHDPDSRLDYTIDWSHWLVTGETIVDSLWTASSVNLVLSDDSFSDTTTTVWVALGVDAAEGDQYLATNHITTSAGRQDDRTLYIKVETR